MKTTYLIILFCVAWVPAAFSKNLTQEWSGFYSGVMAGGQFGRSSDKTGAFGYNADNDQWNYNESGFNAGAEVGYSFLWRQLIIGPEIEMGYLNLEGSGVQPASPGGDTTGKTGANFYSALRARIGVDVYRNLIYVTGGAIQVSYTNQVIDSCNTAPCGGATVDAKQNGPVWGYTAGGGIEHLFRQNWSVKLEGLYFNLGSQNFSGTTNLGNTYNWTGKTCGYIIRGGLNYYFA